MTLRDYLSFIWKEVKTNPVLFFFSLVLAVISLCTGLFIFSGTEIMNDSFYQYFDSESSMFQPVNLELNGLEYHSLDKVEELPFQSFTIPRGLVQWSVFINQTYDNEKVLVETIYQGEKEKRIPVIRGTEFDFEQNDADGRCWVSESFVKTYGTDTGETLVISIPPTKEKKEYVVTGIFPDREDGKIEIFIPFGALYRYLMEQGYYINHSISGRLESSADYFSTVKKLRQMGIYPGYDEESVFTYFNVLRVLSYSFTVIILFIGTVMYVNVMKVILDIRFHYMMRMKILGMKTFQFAVIYGSILEGILLLANAVTAFFGYLFYQKSSALISSMLEIEYVKNRNLLPLFFCFSLIFCNLFLAFLLKNSFRDIDTANPIEVLEGRK